MTDASIRIVDAPTPILSERAVASRSADRCRRRPDRWRRPSSTHTPYRAAGARRQANATACAASSSANSARSWHIAGRTSRSTAIIGAAWTPPPARSRRSRRSARRNSAHARFATRSSTGPTRAGSSRTARAVRQASRSPSTGRGSRSTCSRPSGFAPNPHAACGAPIASSVSSNRNAGGFAPSWTGRLRNALGFFRDERLDGLADASTMVAEIAHRRPDVVHAYPSILSAIADEIVRAGTRDLGLRMVTCGGETLDPPGRRKLEDAFRVPIADLYGAHEFNLVAWQCPAGHGFHVCDDNVVVEILGEDGAPVPVGATGEVVVTGLHGYTMPFVRYRLGDLAVRGPDTCPCGAPWSTLSAIQGRTGDILRLPGGRRVHPYLVTGGRSPTTTGTGSRGTSSRRRTRAVSCCRSRSGDADARRRRAVATVGRAWPRAGRALRRRDRRRIRAHARRQVPTVRLGGPVTWRPVRPSRSARS